MIRVTYHFTNGEKKTVDYEKYTDKMSTQDFLEKYLANLIFFGDDKQTIYINPKQVCWLEIIEI